MHFYLKGFIHNFSAWAIIFFFLASPIKPATADALLAEAFVKDLSQEAVSILSDHSLTDDQLIVKFSRFVSHGFDVPVVGRFALGPYWRAANETQKLEYMDVFFDYIVKTYANRFRQYKVVSVTVNSSRDINNNETIVSSLLVRQAAESINLDWHVRRSDKTDTYKVIDVLFEGMRLGLTLRDEFSTVIRNGGGDLTVLIEDLNSRNKQIMQR